MSISLRRVSAQDDQFLFQLYASTRAAEMALVNWDPVQKQAFLKMQFETQRRAYEHQFPGGQDQIILRDNTSAGRLLIDHSDEYVLIVDIALLPEYRSAGIGTNLIRGLQTEAAESARTLRLHVEGSNPALRLYERLGFRTIVQNGLYWLMEWKEKGRAGAGEEPNKEAVGRGNGV